MSKSPSRRPAKTKARGAVLADDPIDAMRRAIVRAAVPHVPFDGWSLAALRAGARDAGYGEADAVRAFPSGVVDAIELHARMADEREGACLAVETRAALVGPGAVEDRCVHRMKNTSGNARRHRLRRGGYSMDTRRSGACAFVRAQSGRLGGRRM